MERTAEDLKELELRRDLLKMVTAKNVSMNQAIRILDGVKEDLFTKVSLLPVE